MRTRYWLTVTLAGFAVYSAIAVLGTISAMAYFANSHVAIDWTGFIANRFLEQYTCAMFVPAIFWLVERFPLFGATCRRHAAVLLAMMLGFVVIK